MNYEDAKDLLIKVLNLDSLYNFEDEEVYKNNKIIVRFISNGKNGRNLIQADYVNFFDRWSNSTYSSDYKFYNWEEVYFDIQTMDFIADMVCIEVNDDCYDIVLPDEEYEEFFNYYKSEIKEEMKQRF
jgi:hypothetical protein